MVSDLNVFEVIKLKCSEEYLGNDFYAVGNWNFLSGYLEFVQNFD